MPQLMFASASQGFEFALPATSKENFALRYMLRAKNLTSAWLPLEGDRPTSLF
jgi:hypothetical protein